MTDIDESMIESVINSVYNLAILTVGNREAAEQITIDAVVKAYRKQSEYLLAESLRQAYKLGKRAEKYTIYTEYDSELMAIFKDFSYDKRCILILRYKIDYTYEQISRVMKASEKSLRKRLVSH